MQLGTGALVIGSLNLHENTIVSETEVTVVVEE
jgi:hypothetical protein